MDNERQHEHMLPSQQKSDDYFDVPVVTLVLVLPVTTKTTL
jgi:hypothetical protein